jgi:UDP-hydrolysing UDP-N-acetyl-D-glucosamine 2-epimerase
VDDRIEAFSLLIFHPVDEERPHCDSIVRNILGALKAQNIHTFISSPNTDPGNHKIRQVLKEIENDPLFHLFKNLDRETYLSLFKQSRFIIGNSSAGILESASVPLPAINVGLRQQGRSANANVLFCETEEKAIRKAIRIAMSKEFLASLKGMRNIYGDGDSARKALAIIESIEFSPLLRKREDPLSMHPGANTP